MGYRFPTDGAVDHTHLYSAQCANGRLSMPRARCIGDKAMPRPVVAPTTLPEPIGARIKLRGKRVGVPAPSVEMECLRSMKSTIEVEAHM